MGAVDRIRALSPFFSHFIPSCLNSFCTMARIDLEASSYDCVCMGWGGGEGGGREDEENHRSIKI